ncbi:hypothetical protein D3C85_1786120 [compost metagenome]
MKYEGLNLGSFRLRRLAFSAPEDRPHLVAFRLRTKHIDCISCLNDGIAMRSDDILIPYDRREENIIR